MNKTKTFFIAIALVILLVGLDWSLEYYGIMKLGFFGPKKAAIERQIYEQTPSYNEGMNQNVHDYNMQYVQTDSTHKEALADVILHETSSYPDDSLKPQNRKFIQELRDKYQSIK